MFKSFAALGSPFEDVETTSAYAAEATPFANKGYVSEQSFFKRQDVEASHVHRGIAALKHEKLDGAGLAHSGLSP